MHISEAHKMTLRLMKMNSLMIEDMKNPDPTRDRKYYKWFLEEQQALMENMELRLRSHRKQSKNLKKD